MTSAFRSTLAAPALVLAALLVALACGGDGGVDYVPDAPDADYDLEAMALREDDLPVGFVLDGDRDYDNEEYALLFETDDSDAKKRQLDALGRVRNHMAFFSQDPVESYGLPLVVFTSSTIYTDVAAAQESVVTDCGLPIELDPSIEEFETDRLGEEASGFSSIEDDPFTHVNLCFRTGRLVHAVVLRGLKGTEDFALASDLARAMQTRVDAAFTGEDEESDESEG